MSKIEKNSKIIINSRKIYLIILIAFTLGIIISISSSYVLAQTLVKSEDVYYEDNSGLAVNNVQAAIDGTCTKFSNELTNFLNKIYPVGTIYTSTASTNPSSFLGGTWEAYGKGQTLVGIDGNQTEFNTVGKTGGAKSVSYTPSGSIGSTGLTISQIPSHSHNISHTHTTPQTAAYHSLTAESAGDHSHNFNVYTGGTWTHGAQAVWVVNTVTTPAALNFVSGAHTHSIAGTVTVPSMTTNSISTSTSGSAGKGATSDGHTHSFTGTATTINNLQPYVTVYMWRRTK